MSLRTEMREALDGIVPAASPKGLSERVLRTAMGLRAQPRNSARMTNPLRAPVSLVAAFVLISVVAGVLVGGRLLRDWTEARNTVPATRTVAQLEAVPVNLPVVQIGAACPEHPGVNSLGFDYGSGPVYVNGQFIPELTFVDQSGAGAGLYELTYYARPDLTGAVLVRGRDLVNDRPIQFIAPTGIGFPSDTPPWPVKDELALDASHPPSRNAATGYGIWHVRQQIAQGWSGCWGLQIDGSNFSETITGFIRPY